MTITKDRAWTPQACTLPAADRPLRLAAFDELSATALLDQQRPSSTALCWELDPAAEATARDLAGRESSCCSLFTFTFDPGDGVLRMLIAVPGAQVDLLDALQHRAAGRMRS
ncbi:hypothetical protein [Actinoplanes siamensis]|nr:hypothetical protein [Actinoplanes siamensis]